MSAVEAIEQAVALLPATDLAEFRRCFAEYDDAAWQAQIETDACLGKLDAWADEALAEYRAGKARNS